MFPPWANAIWQSLAHVTGSHSNGFAMKCDFGQIDCKALAVHADGLIYDDCYPSPYPWPGPLWVRSSFARQTKRRIADLKTANTFGFHIVANAVESQLIKTITRGSVTCGNRLLSSWRFVRPPFQRALTTILNAAALVPLAAQSLPMRLAAMPLLVQSSVRVLAYCATILTWQAANKQSLAVLHRDAASNNFKTTRADGPGGFFVPALRMAFSKNAHV